MFLSLQLHADYDLRKSRYCIKATSSYFYLTVVIVSTLKHFILIECVIIVKFEQLFISTPEC